MDYPAAARVIHLHLAKFCDESLAFPDMIAEASRRAATKIAELEAELDHLYDSDAVCVCGHARSSHRPSREMVGDFRDCEAHECACEEFAQRFTDEAESAASLSSTRGES